MYLKASYLLAYLTCVSIIPNCSYANAQSQCLCIWATGCNLYNTCCNGLQCTYYDGYTQCRESSKLSVSTNGCITTNNYGCTNLGGCCNPAASCIAGICKLYCPGNPFPTPKPTGPHTLEPTIPPSFNPTKLPTNVPSEIPTIKPSTETSTQPTTLPSFLPAFKPSLTPTTNPSKAPTMHPSTSTAAPYITPSQVPTHTKLPTSLPTCVPTNKLSLVPYYNNNPSNTPSARPSFSTIYPTYIPSQVPVTSTTSPYLPTGHPSLAPSTVSPTTTSSNTPAARPSSSLVTNPSIAPSKTPSFSPSQVTQQIHSTYPTAVEDILPSLSPTALRTNSQTQSPSMTPSQNADTVRAPKLSVAQLSSGGNSITLKFDRPTDLSYINQTDWNCRILFQFIDSEKSICTWIDSSAVAAKLPSPARILPGNNITLLSDLLRASCPLANTRDECSKNPTANIQSIGLQTSAIPIVPIVIISPVVVSYCDGMIIDATASSGNVGRPFSSIQWTVTRHSIFDLAVSSYLNNATSSGNVRIITVPPHLISVGQYSISLRLSNILSHSTTSTINATVSNNPHTPTVQLLGGTNRTIQPYDQLEIFSAASLSTCDINSTHWLHFEWSIQLLRSPSISTEIQSLSKNPRSYILGAYSLSPGQSYFLILTVSTTTGKSVLGRSSVSTIIHVAEAHISAAIVGGYDRVVPIDQQLVLDGSTSQDLNFPVGSSAGALMFSWTCYIQTSNKNNTSCDIPLLHTESADPYAIARHNSSIITIPPLSLQPNTTYRIILHVFSSSVSASTILSDKKILTVITTSPGSISIISTSSITIVNSNTSFILNAVIKANYSVVATWSLLWNSQIIPLQALTKIERTFSEVEVQDGIEFPLSVSPSALVPGRAYTLRLSAFRKSRQDFQTHNDFPITVRMPPQSGIVTSFLQSGYALQTPFTLFATGWVSDDPSGYPLTYSFSYILSDSSPEIPIVTASPQSYITTFLPKGYASLDYNVTVRVTVYNSHGGFSSASHSVRVIPNGQVDVSTLLNKSLSLARRTSNYDLIYQSVGSVSSIYNTVSCRSAPNCSSLNRQSCTTTPNTCGPCLNGFYGYAVNSNFACSTNQNVFFNTKCLSNSDCLSNKCVNNVCWNPQKHCPSSSAGKICSGNGQCNYYDSTGITATTCTLTDSNCYAKCVCISTFGGVDCSIPISYLLQRDASRHAMCDALNVSIAYQNLSPSIVSSLTASMLQLYEASEVISTSTMSSCSNTLVEISNLISAGHISDQVYGTSQQFLDTLSKFINPPASVDLTGNSAVIDLVMSNFHYGYSSTMVPGANPVSFSSDGAIISMHNEYISQVENLVLTTPISIYDYSFLRSVVTLPRSGLQACGLSSSNAQMSLTNWLKNPYTHANGSSSSLLRFALIESIGDQKQMISTANSRFPTEDNLYHVTLQLITPQDFNLTASLSHEAQCVVYDAATDSLVPCQGCNISSVSLTNVTYACSIQTLCDGFRTALETNTTRRLLANTPLSVGNVNTGNPNEIPSTFGTKSVQVENSLSRPAAPNSFSINSASAKVSLSIIALSVAAIALGIFYFLQVDHRERNAVVDANRKMNDEEYAMWRAATGDDNRDVPMGRRNGVSIAKKLSDSLRTTQEMGTSSDSSTEDVNTMKPQNTLSACPTIDEEEHGRRAITSRPIEESQIDDVIHTFITSVIPAWILNNNNAFNKLLHAVKHHHMYVSMFFSYSATRSRTFRYLRMSQMVLTLLFINTMFFQLAYPDTGICENITDKSTCISSTSFTGGNSCSWNDSTDQCSFNAPPKNAIFTLTLSFICLLISIPIVLIFSILDTHVCFKRPNFSSISVVLDSLFDESSKRSELSSPTDPQLRIYKLDNISPLSKDFQPPNYVVAANRLASLRSLENQIREQSISNMALISAQDEAKLIVDEAKFYSREGVHSNPLHGHFDSSLSKEKCTRKSKAILKSIGMTVEGSTPERTLWEYCMTDPRSKLSHQIEDARKKADRLIEAMSNSDMNIDERDRLLLGAFVLEQLSFIKRYRFQLFTWDCVDGNSEHSINPFFWLFGWLLVIGCMVYFIAFIFQWASTSGGGTLYSWGINMALSLTQDIFGAEVARVYAVYILGLDSIRPQLLHIHKVLARVTRKLVSNGPALPSSINRIFQRYSGACRAAHFAEVDYLAASKVLKEVNDDDIEECHLANSNSFSLFASLLFAFPAALSKLSYKFSTIFFQAMILSLVTVFLLVNSVLFSVSAVTLGLLYGLASAFYLYTVFIFRPAKNRMKAAELAYVRLVASSTGGFMQSDMEELTPTWRDRLIYGISWEGVFELIFGSNCCSGSNPLTKELELLERADVLKMQLELGRQRTGGTSATNDSADSADNSI